MRASAADCVCFIDAGTGGAGLRAAGPRGSCDFCSSRATMSSSTLATTRFWEFLALPNHTPRSSHHSWRVGVPVFPGTNIRAQISTVHNPPARRRPRLASHPGGDEGTFPFRICTLFRRLPGTTTRRVRNCTDYNKGDGHPQVVLRFPIRHSPVSRQRRRLQKQCVACVRAQYLPRLHNFGRPCRGSRCRSELRP